MKTNPDRAVAARRAQPPGRPHTLRPLALPLICSELLRAELAAQAVVRCEVLAAGENGESLCAIARATVRHLPSQLESDPHWKATT